MFRPLAICLLLLGACTAPEAEVEFVATRLSREEWEAWSRPGVESAHRHVTVRRTFATSSWCRHLDADLARTGRELTLRVSADAVDEDCPAGAGLWGYMALIGNLEPGRYTLTVIHTHLADRIPPERVLQHEVVVE